MSAEIIRLFGEPEPEPEPLPPWLENYLNEGVIHLADLVGELERAESAERALDVMMRIRKEVQAWPRK